MFGLTSRVKENVIIQVGRCTIELILLAKLYKSQITSY